MRTLLTLKGKQETGLRCAKIWADQAIKKRGKRKKTCLPYDKSRLYSKENLSNAILENH